MPKSANPACIRSATRRCQLKGPHARGRTVFDGADAALHGAKENERDRLGIMRLGGEI